jgi:hypothetical protein
MGEMRGGFAMALGAELVVVIAIIIMAAVVVQADAIGMGLMEWMSP